MSRCHNVLALIPKEKRWDSFLGHVQEAVKDQGREFLVVRTEGIVQTAKNLPGLFSYIEEILSHGPISAITCFVASEFMTAPGRKKSPIAEAQSVVFAALKQHFGSRVSLVGVFVHWDKGRILQIYGDERRIPWLRALRTKCDISSPQERRARCA